MNILKLLEQVDLGAAYELMTSPVLIEDASYQRLAQQVGVQFQQGTLELGAITQPRVDEKTGYSLRVERDAESGFAILPITGTITPYEGCGKCTNPHAIRHDALALLEDDEIHTVVMAIDSPGGTSSGLEQAVEALERLREEKPLIAWNDNLMASAAQWLGAAADEIHSAPSAESGSVGVFIAFPDFSGLMAEKLGIEVNVFRDGDLKGMGVFGKPLTDKEEAYLNDRVQEISGRFKGYMRSRRPGISEDTMQGQTFEAAEAQKRGLIDGISADFTTFLTEQISRTLTA